MSSFYEREPWVTFIAGLDGPVDGVLFTTIDEIELSSTASIFCKNRDIFYLGDLLSMKIYRELKDKPRIYHEFCGLLEQGFPNIYLGQAVKGWPARDHPQREELDRLTQARNDLQAATPTEYAIEEGRALHMERVHEEQKAYAAYLEQNWPRLPANQRHAAELLCRDILRQFRQSGLTLHVKEKTLARRIKKMAGDAIQPKTKPSP